MKIRYFFLSPIFSPDERDCAHAWCRRPAEVATQGGFPPLAQLEPAECMGVSVRLVSCEQRGAANVIEGRW